MVTIEQLVARQDLMLQVKKIRESLPDLIDPTVVLSAEKLWAGDRFNILVSPMFMSDAQLTDLRERLYALILADIAAGGYLAQSKSQGVLAALSPRPRAQSSSDLAYACHLAEYDVTASYWMPTSKIEDTRAAVDAGWAKVMGEVCAVLGLSGPVLP